tara:strand:+ start:125 stop:871 length:747 start_codon:yes stop_codon:yes gene_type:complete
MLWVGTSWKMNHNLPETKKYLNILIKNSKYLANPKINFFIIPPFTSLALFNNYKKKLPFIYGAQNMHWEEKGAFTGEVSASMLKSCGCQIVEIGHAERIKYFNENFTHMSKKINLALKYNLTPIVCIGEVKYEKNISKRKKILNKQIEIILKKIRNKKKQIILAYEPIWAIGEKNKAADVNYCNESISYIRKSALKKLNKVSVIYGGSVNEKNYSKFTESKFIDGIFIGRAALNANNFIKICKGIAKQ